MLTSYLFNADSNEIHFVLRTQSCNILFTLLCCTLSFSTSPARRSRSFVISSKISPTRLHKRLRQLRPKFLPALRAAHVLLDLPLDVALPIERRDGPHEPQAPPGARHPQRAAARCERRRARCTRPRARAGMRARRGSAMRSASA
jgi:hypothetical protein